MIEVHLHGGLAEAPIPMQGATVYEIIDGLSRQLPSMKPDPIFGKKVIHVQGYETEEALHQRLAGDEVLHIYPVLEGEKGKFTQIIAGAVLVALSFVPGLQGIAYAGWSLTTAMAQMGTMMILGGIAQMLAPTPEIAGDDGKQSRILGTGRNTVAVGTPIPILYGKHRVGGHYLSFSVDATPSDGDG